MASTAFKGPARPAAVRRCLAKGSSLRSPNRVPGVDGPSRLGCSLTDCRRRVAVKAVEMGPGLPLPEEDAPEPISKTGQLSDWDLDWVDQQAQRDDSPTQALQKPGTWQRTARGNGDPSEASETTETSEMNDSWEEEWDEDWDHDWDEDEEQSTQPRPKGLPVEVRTFDRATIYVKSGNGGNGCVAFRREKFVPKGGPWGGNGGRGGHVWAVADSSLNSLQSFRRGVHFRAKNGLPGSSNNSTGATGQDLEVKVPPGTIIRLKEAEEGDLPVAELLQEGDRALLVAGGKGGRGNSSFKSNLNNCPVIGETGEEGEDVWLQLELKLVADVGIVGIPSAGKSTLLSVVSSAKPKIADYPFTTLTPNLGVCELDFQTTVFADVPGLLEGAHLGRGLGLEFLRHTERCRAIVHVIDGSSPDPIGDYKAIRLEMRLFNPAIAKKPEIIAYNKMDIPDSSDYFDIVREFLMEQGVPQESIFPISAATGKGIEPLVRAARRALESLGPVELEYTTDALNIQEVPKKDMTQRMDDFEVTEDHAYGRCYVVSGQGIERFAQMTNFDYFEGARRFQQVLKRVGVFKTLRKRGVREGDTVLIGQMETVWSDDQSDRALFKAWKETQEGSGQGQIGSARWPRARLNS